jgi:hypothetical protein
MGLLSSLQGEIRGDWMTCGRSKENKQLLLDRSSIPADETGGNKIKSEQNKSEQ